MTLFLSSRHGKHPLVGVEIGVESGVNAESMLETLNIRTLYLVDPYIPYIQDKRLIDSSQAEVKAHKKLGRFGERVKWLRMLSHVAVKHLPDGLDFVYIDGNHEYSYVKQDITDYYQKVKFGGVLGGHDFFADYLGVCQAVFEFSWEYGLKLHGSGADWWVVK